MSFRALIAVLVSISVALVPASATVAVASMHSAALSSGAAPEIHCCAPDDCKASTACSVKCFGCGVAVSLAEVLPPQVFHLHPVAPVAPKLTGYAHSPPRHPPRPA